MIACSRAACIKDESSAGVLHAAVCLHRRPEENCPDDPAGRRRRRAGAAGGPAGCPGPGGEPGTVRLAQPLSVQRVRKLGGGGVHDVLLQVIAAAGWRPFILATNGGRRMDSAPGNIRGRRPARQASPGSCSRRFRGQQGRVVTARMTETGG